MNTSKADFRDTSPYVQLITLSEGILFFERTVEVFKTTDIAHMRSACTAFAGITCWKKFLFDRKAYTEKCLVLFKKIKDQDQDETCNIDDIISFFKNSDYVLSMALCGNDFIYSIDILSGLSKLMNQSKDYLIDSLMIDFLRELYAVNNHSVRNCFLDKLMWLSQYAIVNNFEGFNLLKDFTIEVLNSLNEQDCQYFDKVIDTMHARISAINPQILSVASVFTKYQNELKTLK